MNEEASDREIISRVCAGEVNAFELLVERYEKRVFQIVGNHVRREDIEEVAQDVFVKTYQALKDFRGESDFENWISKIAVRRCYDYWRKKRRTREVPMSSIGSTEINWVERVLSGASIEEFNTDASKASARAVLSNVLDKLSDADRMVITLVYLEEHTVQEAADLLGWSVANVKVRAHRARKKLYALIEGVGEKDG